MTKRILAIILIAQATICACAQDSVATVRLNPFRDNWYIKAGTDVTLHCPYAKDFGDVIPKGTTFGIDAAVGKWFSPQIAASLHLNWENGLLPNTKVEWVAPGSDPAENHRKGGMLSVSLEVPVSVSNIIWHYDPNRRWNLSAYARAGIINVFSTKSNSPLVGGGIEYTYRIKPGLHAYGNFGLTTTTSESYNGVSCTGMGVSTGFNCFFNIEAGVVIDLGRRGWK